MARSKEEAALFEQVDLQKLTTAIDRDYLALEIYRDNLVKHVKEFVGKHYSDNGSECENPFNLISLFVRIISDYLIGDDPRFMASTFTRELRPYASILEKWGNKELTRLGFQGILHTAVRDATFLMGWVKVSLAAPAEARFGYAKQIGKVSIANVDFDDMIFDTRARRFSEVDYIGHYYDVFYDDVKDSSLFDKKAKLKVVPREDKTMTTTGGERLREIGRGGVPNSDEYYEKVTLCEVWLRRENIVVTFDANGDRERPLMAQKWVGPHCGPYIEPLSFSSVPGSLMPKSPIMDQIDMHNSMNLLWSKVDNQASRAKKITLYKDASLAKRIQDAHDGDLIQSEDPQGVNELSLGGPDQNTSTWMGIIYQMYSEYVGNLKSLGGLGAQSDTATQEKLVHASASNLIQAMGGRVVDFSERVMNSLGWYWWNSPRQEMKSTYADPRVPDVEIERNLTPYKRFGVPYEEIDIKIDPHSYIRQTPQMKVRSIDNLLGMIIKVLPAMGQPGVREMVAEWVRLHARWENNPELEVLLEKLQGVEGPSPDQELSPQQESPDAPQETVHTRVSQPGMNDQAHMQVLQQMMASGTPTPGTQAGGLGQMTQAG